MFDVDRFLRQIGEIAQRSPHLRPQLYANAAAHLDAEASKRENIRSRLRLQMLARQLGEIAARLALPDVDPVSGEMIQTFLDGSPEVATDFDALVAAHQGAAVDDNGVAHGELFAASQLEAANAAATLAGGLPAPTPPAIGQTPASAAKGPLLGNQALVQYGPSVVGGSFAGSGGVSGAVPAQSEAQVVRWDGETAESMAVTLDFSVIRDAGSAIYPAPQYYRPYAKLQFGVSHGVPHEVTIDIGRGAQVTVAAAFVYASVGIDEPPPGQIRSGSMVLAGSIGFYAAAGRQTLYRTIYLDAIASNGSTTVIVPRFANTIEGFLGATANNWTLKLQSLGGPIPAGNDDLGTITPPAVGATAVPWPIPLSSDVYQIVCTNTGATTDSARLIFGISL